MVLEDYVKVYKLKEEIRLGVLDLLSNIPSESFTPHIWYSSSSNETDFHSADTESKIILEQNFDWKSSAFHEDFINEIHRILDEYTNYIYNDLNHHGDNSNGLKINKFHNVRFGKYEVGSSMRYHVDHIHALFDGNEKGIPILSVNGVLNDDFEGGDFIMNNKSYDLNNGGVIISPSIFLYPHEVLPIISGTRYQFVTWAY